MKLRVIKDLRSSTTQTTYFCFEIIICCGFLFILFSQRKQTTYDASDRYSTMTHSVASNLNSHYVYPIDISVDIKNANTYLTIKYFVYNINIVS